MAKDRRKVQHIHSSVFDKQPTPESLELGELAVNANKNGSFISTKNTDNEVVRFSEDATIVDWMEYKEVFPYSATVTTPTEQDLKNNKSQLLFKINQVVPTKTPYGSNVNGARDMHGDEINPLSPDGTKDGAGFAVNMDMYAMNGGNPSFSSITTTCGALLQGTTKIQGLDGSCGSLLDVNVTESHFLSDTFEVDGNHIAMAASGDGTDEGVVSLYGTKRIELTAAEAPYPDAVKSVIAMNKDGQMHILATDNICEEVTSGDATFYGSENTNIGVSCDDTATAATTNIRGDKVIVDAGVTNLALTAKEDILESAENDIVITANNNLCSTAGVDATYYGVTNTNIGADCHNANVSTTTTINGETITGSGGTVNVSSTGATCVAAGTNANFYGATTNIGRSCDNNTSTTTNIEGTTINEGGTNLTQNFTNGTVNITNYDVNGDVICISGATNANIYGAETNIGIDCNNTTTATTINISGTTINLGGDEVTINVLDDLCLNSREDITLYGSQNTNVGISCDGTTTAATTTVRGNKVIVDAAVGNLGLTAKEDILESAENDIFITANNVICETAGADVTIYGVESTNVGVNCSGSSPSTLTTINGETININSPITNFDGDVIVSGSVVVNDGLGAKVCSVYGDVRNENGKCSNLSGSTTTNFTIPNEFSHMKNHKNSDGMHETDYYTFEYPVEVDGTITANRAIYSSDIALKDNIRAVSRNDFNKVKRVDTKSFVFKDDPHRTKTYGVIAQEVEAAGLGELVYTKEDGFKAVDYTAFMMLKLSYLEDFCINLSMQNEELKKKIKDLENKK